MSESAGPVYGRIGILLNPQSGRVRRRLSWWRKRTASVPGAVVLEAVSPPEVARALDQLRGEAVGLLVLIGGDGTLQALLTAAGLAGREPLPVLVIPGGTTNMSALGLGAGRSAEAALRALIRWRRGEGPAPAVVHWPLLRVVGAARVQQGFFFGTGAVQSGVSYFHERLRPTGIKGTLGPSLALCRMLAALLRGRPHPLLPTTRCQLEGDGVRWENDWLLVLASTLDRLLLGCRPYWGQQPAPMHFTAVARNPRRLPRKLVSILRGRGAAVARSEEGYLSENLHQLTLTGAADFILDGELFHANSPLQVATTAPQQFLVF